MRLPCVVTGLPSWPLISTAASVAGFPKFELSDRDATIAIFPLFAPLAAAPELDVDVVEPEPALALELELELELDPQPAANAAVTAHAVSAKDRTHPLLICSPFIVVGPGGETPKRGSLLGSRGPSRFPMPRLGRNRIQGLQSRLHEITLQPFGATCQLS